MEAPAGCTKVRLSRPVPRRVTARPWGPACAAHPTLTGCAWSAVEWEGIYLHNAEQRLYTHMLKTWLVQRKTEGTKQQQNHRTQEWTNSYQRERDWEGWVGREGQGRGKRKGALRSACIMWGGLHNAEKTSSDTTTSCYADGQ